MDGILSGDNDTAANLVKSGDTQKAAQYANAVTSVLNDNGSSGNVSTGNKTKVQ